MVYYVGIDSVLNSETAKMYKTEKGAVAAAEKDSRLTVWDESGRVVRPAGGGASAGAEDAGAGQRRDAEPDPADGAEEERKEAGVLFFVKTLPDRLNIRLQPKPFGTIIGVIDEKESKKKEHGICDVHDGYGKLSDWPNGWVQLSLTRATRKG